MSGSQRYSGKSLKASLKAFGIGKLASASLGLVNFALLTRILPVSEYGNYVAIFAAIELGLFFSTIGVDWVAVRYVPQFRAKGDDLLLRRFMQLILGVRTTQLLLLAGFFYLVLPYFGVLGLPGNWHTYSLYICVIAICEGMSRFIREFLFESLLLQKYSQISLVARSSFMTAGLFWIHSDGANTAGAVLRIESLAVVTSLLATAAMLASFVLAMPKTVREGQTASLLSYRSDFLRCAANNYLSGMFAYLGSGQMMVLAVARFLGAEAAAMFGYARYLIEFVRRYLPGELLNGLIRPKLIADYASSKSFHKLNLNTKIIFKLNAAFLAVGLLSLLISGQELLAVLSGRKFDAALPPLVLMCATLIPFCHRRLLETVANAIDLSHAWSRASFILSFSVPLAILGMYFDVGIYAAIGAIFATEMMANSLLISSMRRAGFSYEAGLISIFKLAFFILIAFVLATALFSHVDALSVHWLVQLGFGVVSLVALLVFFPLFPQDEKRHILTFMGK